MLKGMLLGALVGAILAAVSYRVFAPRREIAPPPAGGTAAPAPAVPDAELEKARTQNAKLLEELAAARKAPDTAATTAAIAKPPVKSLPTWKELGARVYKLRDQLKNRDQMSPEMTALWSDFIAVIGQSAQKDGVTIDEAMMGPGGMLGLLVGILEGSDLPPDGGQQAKLDLTMEAMEKGWKDYLAGRGELTAMERDRALLALTGGGMNDMRAAMTAAQIDMLDKMEMFKGVPGRGLSSQFNGDRTTVASQLADRWKSDLGLDDSQTVSIRPIVDEYMRGFDALEMEAERLKSAGAPMDDWTKALQRQDLMLAVQKRMKDTLRLTDAQAAAMKEWSGTFGYSVTEGK